MALVIRGALSACFLLFTNKKKMITAFGTLFDHLLKTISYSGYCPPDWKCPTELYYIFELVNFDKTYVQQPYLHNGLLVLP